MSKWQYSFAAVGLTLSLVLGCSSKQQEAPSVAEELKPLLEPFDPPPLAEIDAKAEWQDNPVVDPMELLRERQAKEEPLATAEEALALKNDSAKNNEIIRSALGRLPENEEQVDYDARINRHAIGDVNSTNPIMISSTTEFDVLGLTGISFFGFDWNMEPLAVDESVVSWQTSKDRMYDKVVIRDDLTWSDGKPVTAHDIAFSFQTIMDPRVPVPAVRSGTDQLRWVHAYDDHTVMFFHKEPLATNIWNINFPTIPKHIYEKTLDADPTLKNSKDHVFYESNPVTAGPYELTRRERGQEILLTRRESYYMHNGKQVRPKPYFKEIRFRIVEDPNTALLALKSGDLDEQLLSPEQWTTSQTNDEDFYERNTKSYGPEWTFWYFGWNNSRPYFADKRVRQAMSFAYNHEEMLEKLCYGLYEPSTGLFHKDSWMAPKNTPQPYQQNLNKAEDLLDAAGWVDSDGDGVRDKEVDGRQVRFEFTILTRPVPLQMAICTLLKENLNQIGIVCNVRPLETTVFQQQTLEHKFDAFLGGWGTGTDPDTTENIFGTGKGRNFVEYSNSEVDELYKKGRYELDKEKRAEHYARIHEILWEDQPYTWLYFRSGFYGFNKDLRGYVYSPRGPFHYNPGFSSFWRVAER